MTIPLTPWQCAAMASIAAADVERLAVYLDLLTHWQRRINLVGASTLADPWRRHILDSAQLLPLIPDTADRLIDLGSGAGFPGLVLAILRPRLAVTLIDRDARKCAFLGEAIRRTGAGGAVINGDLATVPPLAAGVVTARALAPLPKLLTLTAPWLTRGARGLFLKGRDLADELTAARETWNITADVQPSLTDDAGHILTVHNLERRRDR